MNEFFFLFLFVINLSLLFGFQATAQHQMIFGDTSRLGRPFSKDPHVVKFKGAYLMYYSIPPKANDPESGWNIGIARSNNLIDWTPIGDITPQAEYEAKRLCAPGALLRNDTIHLFYQTYGNGQRMRFVMPIR